MNIMFLTKFPLFCAIIKRKHLINVYIRRVIFKLEMKHKEMDV